MKMVVYKKSHWRQRKLAVSTLLQAAKNMQQKDAVVMFIHNLLTEDEQVTLGRRLLIAQMILSGKTQAEIKFELGVSPNTFTRTRKWLEKEIPEYGKAVQAYKEGEQKKHAKKVRKTVKKERPAPFTFAHMKQRYPMHFLLFNIADDILKNLKKDS